MKHLPIAALLALSALLLPACQTQEHIVLVAVKESAIESPAQAVSKSTRAAAAALLAALNDEQKQQVLHDIQAPLKKDWHFVPRQRAGVMLGDMTADQKKLVHNLMQTALSDSGYLKATDIIWLETVLYEMSNQHPMRDPGKYALQIFGDPADEDAAWAWRLEGHHLSLNLTYTPERIGVTPLFFGSNPAVVQQGPLAGKRVLADTHNLAVELAKSMSEDQREKMLLAEKPRDVISGPGREGSITQPSGISVEELSFEQVGMLNSLLESHLDSYRFDHRKAAFTKKAELGPTSGPWNSWFFAWAGPIDADKPFYYRIQCPRFVIEYSCQGRNHVHCVIHDLTDPLQEDLLKKHFEQHEHE